MGWDNGISHDIDAARKAALAVHHELLTPTKVPRKGRKHIPEARPARHITQWFTGCRCSWCNDLDRVLGLGAAAMLAERLGKVRGPRQ